MTRKEFIKICGILGVSLPLQSSLMSCGDSEEITTPFKGKVIIIGAGAGGLAAGYLLKQQGVDFEIFEASNEFGGRMKINTGFADFPTPLGAEWLETSADVFSEIVNNNTVNIEIQTVVDEPDRKFVNSSWYGFFEKYITPTIQDKITYNRVVEIIDFSGNDVKVLTADNQYSADKVIVSVPLKILQDGDIRFMPDLPQGKASAINNSVIWEGFKAFIVFKTKFYNDEYQFEILPPTDGEKIYYNASLGQNTEQHIIGLFVVGKPALAYIDLTDIELKALMLDELDSIYNNQATPNYIKHISQNWKDEPFIKAGYLTDYADWRVVRELGKSVANKIYFAGGAYTDGEDWVSVHTAAKSARAAIHELSR